MNDVNGVCGGFEFHHPLKACIPIGDCQSVGHKISTGHRWLGSFQMHRSVPILISSVMYPYHCSLLGTCVLQTLLRIQQLTLSPASIASTSAALCPCCLDP